MLIEKLQDYKVILGSGSPRRKQLLSEMGIQFDVRPAKVDEVFPDNLTCAEIAEYLSKIKADAFSADGVKKLQDIGVTECIIGGRDAYKGKQDTSSVADKVMMMEWFAENIIAKS